jgi:hypothetical protein
MASAVAIVDEHHLRVAYSLCASTLVIVCIDPGAGHPAPGGIVMQKLCTKGQWGERQTDSARVGADCRVILRSVLG